MSTKLVTKTHYSHPVKCAYGDHTHVSVKEMKKCGSKFRNERKKGAK